MRHRVGAHLFGDLDLPLRDQWTRNRGPQQVLALIQRIRAKHREHEVADEFFAQVIDEDFLYPEHLGLLARRP